MSLDTDSVAGRRHLVDATDDAVQRQSPPEIRVDDEEDMAAEKLTPPGDATLTGAERRRSMPASHGRFVDEPYVFSLSQALAMSGRRRSEPLTESAGEMSHGGTKSVHRRHVFVDQLSSSNKCAVLATTTVDSGTSPSSPDVTSKTSTTATVMLPSLDESSRLSLSHGSRADSADVDQMTVSGTRFLSLPQTSDYLTVPARRHSVALVQPTSSRLLDVIDEETAVVTDSKSLASSRRYSVSCHLNT